MYTVINSQGVEWHLHSHRPPFKDLADLHRHYDLPENESGDRTLIELVAAPPIAMTRRSTIENGRLLICIQAAKGLSLERLSVGYVAEAAAEVKRGNVDSIRWVEKEGVLEGSAELDLGGCSAADCLLVYAGTGIQHLRLMEAKRLLNLRTAIQEVFDPGLRRTRQLVFEAKRDDAKRFEDGVAILLGMLGFSIVQHGRATKLAEAPDIVAITEEGHLAVVECTTDLPDKGDQVATVVKRAEQARRGLNSTGWSHIEVLPVVVTLLGDREITGQKDDAEGKGVLVLCAEDLRKTLELTKYPVDADDVFKRWVNQMSRPKFMRS
jgi:hypothetical protein